MIPPAHADAFLASCGWTGARIEPLAGDASFRRYFRVVGEDRSAVLMDAPPPLEDVRPFVAVAEWLAKVGLSAPEIIARDLDRGLLLLDDFGDWRLREMLDDDPSQERRLYELATDVLIHLHSFDADAGPAAAGARPVARGAGAVHRLVLPGARARGRRRRLPRGVDRGARARSPTTALGR